MLEHSIDFLWLKELPVRFCNLRSLKIDVKNIENNTMLYILNVPQNTVIISRGPWPTLAPIRTTCAHKYTK